MVFSRCRVTRRGPESYPVRGRYVCVHVSMRSLRARSRRGWPTIVTGTLGLTVSQLSSHRYHGLGCLRSPLSLLASHLGGWATSRMRGGSVRPLIET